MPTVTICDLPSGRETAAWIDRRAHAAARTWTTAQRTHPGDVGWSAAQHDLDPSRRARVWTDSDSEVLAWALVEDVTDGTVYADVHIDPRHLQGADDLRAEVVDFACAHAGTTLVPVLDRERGLLEACVERGGMEQEGPWFTHLLTDFTDLAPRRLRPLLPDGYRIRPVRDDEVVARVEVHRRAWSPDRILRLVGVEPTGNEGESAFNVEAYERVRGTALYRTSLDLVVEAPDGRLAASALGWYDEVSGSGLIEPVGTDPAFAARGLGRAACAELLREMARLGARVALVCPRGDDQYPVPARLYRSLGMRPVARTKTLRIPRAA